MKQFTCCFVLVLLCTLTVRGDDAILAEAISNANKQERFRLEDGKQVRYSITEHRNGSVIQRVDGFMVHQNGEALHRRVEDRMQLSTSSLAVNLNSAKFRADLRCDMHPRKVLPKADEDMAGQEFVIVDYATDQMFHPGGVIHFAPAVASSIPKYSLVSNFEKWRDAGNKAQYTAPSNSNSEDAKFHKFVLSNWPQEYVPELTLWVDERMRIVKRASKEEKFGFNDVCTILETVELEGVAFPVHFIVERTRAGSDPKSFKTEVKASITDVRSVVPAAWFTMEHYGVTPREQPKFASPPSNTWKLYFAASLFLACCVAFAFYLRRRQR